MITNPFVSFIFHVFLVCAVLITMYTCNFYYLTVLASRKRGKSPTVRMDEPPITIHLPIYNERYVAVRLVDAVCAMDYPKDRMRIMVLDDSDDETEDLMRKTVLEYSGRGYDIEHVRRGTRAGYKAGALKNAMRTTDTDFVAIFDADFIPPRWFLQRAIPHFAGDRIGLVQCRWGHVNENYSTITRAQALSLDFHFLIEQRAKSDSHLFMNFNGTAGIWRRRCIEDAGGWHTATLVEDLDLSYRAQMRGWRCLFLPDVVVDAELPVQMNAAKRQQFRWAKGSIQCATKLLYDIASRPRIALEAKFQAFIQLTRHVVYPLMLVQFLALPILLASDVNIHMISFLPALTVAAYLAMGPGAYVLIMQKMYASSWKSKYKVFPSLLVYNAGMSVNNTVAVFDALFGKRSEFLRTPKYGIVKKDDGWKDKAYNLPFTKTTLLEIFFGAYGVLGVMVAVFSNNPVFAPILGIQAVGFLYVAWLSLSHSRFKRNKSRAGRAPARGERMANLSYKLATGGIVAIIALGLYAAMQGYATDIYPLDLARGNMAAIVASADTGTITEHILEARANLPAEGNPVWLFPTASTDFGRMQLQLAQMLEYAEQISAVPMDSSAYNTAMLKLSGQASELRENIMDATPYMYVSVSNMILSAVWIAAIIGIFAVLKRKKDQLAKYDEADGV